MLNHWASCLERDVRVFSAARGAGFVDPLATDVLQRAGIDVAGLRGRSMQELLMQAVPTVHVVIRVFDVASDEQCPRWPGGSPTVCWHVKDPARVEGALIERRLAFELARRALGLLAYQMLELPLAYMEPRAIVNELQAIGSE
jgi:arsenate reductase